jgi:hypothetical protein
MMGIVEIGILVTLAIPAIAATAKLLWPRKAKQIDEMRDTAHEVWQTVEGLSRKYGWQASEKKREYDKRFWERANAMGLGSKNPKRLALVDAWAEEFSAKQKLLAGR